MAVVIVCYTSCKVSVGTYRIFTMNIYQSGYSDSDSDEETLNMLNEINIHFTRPYVVRPREDNYNKWDDVEFMRRFRVSKVTSTFILNKIENKLSYITTRNNGLSARNQLLLTLRFFATGCMQITSGDFSGVHQTTAGRVIKRVTQAIASKRREFIKLALTREQISKNFQDFYNIARFPRVYGALDCTHIRLQSPGGNTAEIYRNRKGYFFINTQALCSANLKFMDIIARWPGATHDSTIFHNSSLCALFESNRLEQCVILGDAGYPLKNYLLTPLQNPVSDQEKLYNESHIRTRNCIERCFGVWKRRFRVLSLGIKVKVELAQDIIATAILHNLCLDNEDDLPTLSADVEHFVDLSSHHTLVESSTDNINELNNRRVLINSYFYNL